MTGALVELCNVSKSFGSTRALDGVSFQVRPGEVHVLAGENGAGKSTLIRILSGAIVDYEGALSIEGQSVRFAGPADAVRAKIATIHQELSLVGPMTVADNLALGSRGRSWWRREPAVERTRARQLLAEMRLDVDPDTSVDALPLSVQQQLEIGRALERGARVIVMDEPTSALGEPEAERLFERVRELRQRGAAIVYISHRMEEIFRLADRITVLRDGKHVLTAPAAELDRGKLVEAMIGRALGAATARRAASERDVALQVRDLTHGSLKQISFELRRGEILGVAGLAGSGASTLLHALFGSLPGAVAGSICLDGVSFSPHSPRTSIAGGIVLLGNDRRLSLVPELTIAENTTLSSLARWSRWGVIARRAEQAAALGTLKRLDVRGASDLGLPVRALSGGNQQKVALGRCLLTQPRVLLLDEPTRGIDVGAKADVYTLVSELARSGVSVLFVASEMEELLALSDRVIVLARGRLVDELGAAELSRERILASAMGAGAA